MALIKLLTAWRWGVVFPHHPPPPNILVGPGIDTYAFFPPTRSPIPSPPAGEHQQEQMLPVTVLLSLSW